MTSSSRVSELDVLRSQVADLSRELAERDHLLREQSEMFRAILVSPAAETGTDFFPTFVRQLTSVLGVQYALIGELKQDDILKVHTVAVCAGGVLLDNFEYPLANMPCESVLWHSVVCIEREAGTAFPAFKRLAQLSVEGYCGVAIRDRSGAAIGLLAVMDTKPLRNTECLRSLMTAFASRAGAELERQKAETELRQHQRRLLEAQAFAHLGSWDWDIGSGTVQWSDEQFRIFGYEPGTIAVTYDTFLTLLHPDDHDRVLASFNDALLGTRPTDVEYRIVRPNGEIRTVHGRSDVFRDDTGHPIRMAGICLDITDRKLTEEERLRLFSFLDHVPNVAFLKSSSGHYLYTNRRFDEVFSFARGDALGKTDDELFSPQQALQFRTNDQLVLASGQAHEFDEVAQHTDGTHVNIVVKFPLNIDESGLPPAIVGIATDITQRERTQDQLRLYRQIFARSIDGIAVMDLKGQFLEQNAAHERMLGYSQDHLAGKTPAIYLGEEMFARIGQELATNGVYRGEVQCRTATGESPVIDLAAFSVRDPNGSLMRNVVIKRDITERKKAEQALRESEARYLSLIEAIPQQVWTARPDGTLDYVNRRVLDYFRCQPDDLLGREWQSVLHPEDLPACLASWSNALRTGEPYEIEFRLRRAFDGAYRWHLARALPVKDASNCILKWFGTNTDITERKQAEEALRISEERYARATAIGKVGVWELDVAKGTYHGDVNLKALFGYADDELSTDPYAWLNLVHPKDQSIALDHWQRIVSGAMEHYNYEIRMLRKDGTIIWTDVRGHAVRDATGRLTHLIGATVDITDRKRVEESLRQREQELQTVLKERERISEDLHDGILQSLYAVGLSLESCKTLMRHRTHKEAIALLNHAIVQLNHVMTEVRNFIAGLESQVLQGGDFATALQTMVRTMSASAATACRVSIKEAAARQLSTEQALHVINVVREALSNSLRHSRAKRITVSLRPHAEVIRLSVVDDGVGFRPAAAHSVGHGLTNMVARARKMGGRFAVRSTPLKGTKILLDLPKVTMSAHH
jgi:PAS domain S-box-containing protein